MQNGKVEFNDSSILVNFINLLVQNMPVAKMYVENNSQYFNIIAKFAMLGPEARLYLLKIKILTRISNFYLKSAEEINDEGLCDMKLEFFEILDTEIGFQSGTKKA